MVTFPTSRVCRALSQVALAAVAFVLASRFITPGFFEPLVPSHSDVWRYFSYAQAEIPSNLLTSPRPLMLILIKLLGVTSDFRLFTFGLLLPAILAPVFLVAMAEKINDRRWPMLVTFLYFVLCFALESFYELHLLDFGGCVAVIFGAIAVMHLEDHARAAERGSRHFTVALAWAMLFVWLSMEAKPTWALVLLAAPALFAQRLGWRRCVEISAAVGLIIFLVLLKDKLMGSPFLDTSTETSNYRLAHSLPAMAESFWFYVSRILPLGAWPLVIVGLLVLAHARSWRVAVALPILAVLAVLPMIAIPNNRVPMYAWFGASIVLLSLPMMFVESRKQMRPWLTVATAPLFVGAIWAMMLTEPTARYWYTSNHKANAQALVTLSAMERYVRPGASVLFAGAHNAFSPLKNDQFVRAHFKYDLDWRVTVPKGDAGLIAGSRDTSRLVLLADVQPANFDLIAYMARDGRLLRVGPASELARLPPAERVSQLLCQEDRATIAACLNQAGEVEAAAALSSPSAADR